MVCPSLNLDQSDHIAIIAIVLTDTLNDVNILSALYEDSPIGGEGGKT